MLKKSLICWALGAGALSLPPQSQAQPISATLEQRWTDGQGFATYTWMRAEDRGDLYSSDIVIRVSGNRATFFNTFKVAPFGKYARCGGLGCDLGVGQQIAQLDFTQRGEHFVVMRASGGLAFLLGSDCHLKQSYLRTLECQSAKNPAGVNNMPSIYKFEPGT